MPAVQLRPSPWVLIVDEDPRALALLRQVLEDEGAHILAATSCRQAARILEAVPALPLAAAFVAPPEDDARWRSRLSFLAEIPLVLLSGRADRVAAEESLRNRVAEVLWKPFSRDEVRQALRHVQAPADGDTAFHDVASANTEQRA